MSCDIGEDGRSWPRQNSLTNKEWEIPLEEVKLDSVIGTGRLGTVFKGQWHGLVAVKRVNLSSSSSDSSGKIEMTPEDKKYLSAFRQEVATFRKTRHDNLVLFMGACMKPPHLAIVTSLCKGATLYTHLHVDKAKFDSRTTPLLIIQQICQGMSYLHARGIVHKDLKTKNIFYDRSNGKVVITDFGLFSVTKLCLGSNNSHDYLTIPRGWLCYLSPEMIQALRPGDQDNDDLPFSTASDVFAFG
jgi:kinase suppressor of Ras 2